MELISVIIPIYKAEKYLNRCIESVVKQTYKSLEIILVDDGSPDLCPDICDKWKEKDKRITVIHQKNGGISSARNTGISNATGDYLLMVDSDDYLSLDMIQKLHTAIKKTDAELALCNFERGIEDTYIFPANEGGLIAEVIDAKTALERSYNGSHEALQYIVPWGKLYRKELFAGLSYPEGKIFEDIYLTHQIIYRCKKIAVVNQKLTYYFQHSESIMNKKFHIGKLDYLDATRNRIAFFEKNDLPVLSRIAYEEYLHSLTWEYSRTRDILHDKEAMDDIIKRFREVYKAGFSSSRYPMENARFLKAFNRNPEWIIMWWKISSKMSKIFRGKEHS